MPPPAPAVCPLCRSADHCRPVYSSPQKPPVEVSLCGHCGFAFTWPRPTDAALAAFYATQHLVYEHGPQSRQHRIESARIAALRPVFDIVAQTSASPSVCDIGCGHGDFLAQCPATWRRVGLEANPTRAAFARAHYGLEIQEDPLEEISRRTSGDEAAKFDLVSLLMVLEHIAQPRPFLRQAISLLKPGGRLCVSVPNTLTPTVGLEEFFGFEHVNHFTADVLRRFARSEGLTEEFTQVDAGGLAGILFVGRHDAGPTDSPMAPIDPALLEPLLDCFRDYARQRTDLIEHISRQITSAREALSEHRLAIYGSGDHTDYLRQIFPEFASVRYYIDRSEELHGRPYGAGTVYPPSALGTLPVTHILVSSHAFQDEIRAHLEQTFPGRFKIVALYPANDSVSQRSSSFAASVK